ncbi:hypothetical protein HNP48_001515 [Acidovorax soli]|uniref:Uncharacterized protein n=1 Tax=Acidovorax soli TaxID=592050 RepID=A0A7X0PBM0_9BURK|nr:hypothetical protein [Acidovorax soli]MBB6558851.1 hypothetical protein [Acidovorax soli]
MTFVTTAFRRWLAAEQDANEATRSLLSMVLTVEAGDVAEQQDLVKKLRKDAHDPLQEYLAAVQCASAQLWHFKAAPLLADLDVPKKGPHEAG